MRAPHANAKKYDLGGGFAIDIAAHEGEHLRPGDRFFYDQQDEEGLDEEEEGGSKLSDIMSGGEDDAAAAAELDEAAKEEKARLKAEKKAARAEEIKSKKKAKKKSTGLGKHSGLRRLKGAAKDLNMHSKLDEDTPGVDFVAALQKQRETVAYSRIKGSPYERPELRTVGKQFSKDTGDGSDKDGKNKKVTRLDFDDANFYVDKGDYGKSGGTDALIMVNEKDLNEAVIAHRVMMQEATKMGKRGEGQYHRGSIGLEGGNLRDHDDAGNMAAFGRNAYGQDVGLSGSSRTRMTPSGPGGKAPQGPGGKDLRMSHGGNLVLSELTIEQAQDDDFLDELYDKHSKYNQRDMMAVKQDRTGKTVVRKNPKQIADEIVKDLQKEGVARASERPSQLPRSPTEGKKSSGKKPKKDSGSPYKLGGSPVRNPYPY